MEKPERFELTREVTTITDGYDNQSSLLIFHRTRSVTKDSASQEGPPAESIKGHESDIDALITLLCHEKHDIRITAAKALGNLGDPAAIEPLFKTCMDENTAVKSAARDALALIVAKLHYSQ